MTTSPAARSSVALAGTGTPLTRFRPGAPSPPPCAPRGEFARRSVSSDSRQGSSTSQLADDAVASGVLAAPTGPETQRVALHAQRVLELERLTGVESVLDIATCTPLGPSASGHAPWPPPMVS